MRKFTITYNVQFRCPRWVVYVQCPCPAGSTHVRLPRPPGLSNDWVTSRRSHSMSLQRPSGLSNDQLKSRCSLLCAGLFRMIEELTGILSRCTIFMSFTQPDYNQLHALTTTLDINTSFTHQSYIEHRDGRNTCLVTSHPSHDTSLSRVYTVTQNDHVLSSTCNSCLHQNLHLRTFQHRHESHQAVYGTILSSTVEISSLHQAVYVTIYRPVRHEPCNM